MATKANENAGATAIESVKEKLAEVVIKKCDEILTRPDRINDPSLLQSLATLYSAMK